MAACSQFSIDLGENTRLGIGREGRAVIVPEGERMAGVYITARG